jgi:hypothetical protein
LKPRFSLGGIGDGLIHTNHRQRRSQCLHVELLRTGCASHGSSILIHALIVVEFSIGIEVLVTTLVRVVLFTVAGWRISVIRIDGVIILLVLWACGVQQFQPGIERFAYSCAPRVVGKRPPTETAQIIQCAFSGTENFDQFRQGQILG